MTLYEYIQLTEGQEITVFDKDYDVEFYVERYDEGDDVWNNAMIDICKCLEIIKIGEIGIVTNFCDVVEAKLEELDKADLFIECDIDSIMCDMDNILAGYVSENWLRKFADILLGKDGE